MAPLWSDQRLITTFATFEQMPKNSSSSPRAPYSFDLTAIVQKKCRNLLSCTMCSTILHLLGLRCDCQCICVGLSHHLPRRHEHLRNFCVICSRSLSCTFELRSVFTSSESVLLPSPPLLSFVSFFWEPWHQPLRVCQILLGPSAMPCAIRPRGRSRCPTTRLR